MEEQQVDEVEEKAVKKGYGEKDEDGRCNRWKKGGEGERLHEKDKNEEDELRRSCEWRGDDEEEDRVEKEW